jgi:arsenate reductase (glutaredoxin)
MYHLYGIPNCDTVKKAKKHLEKQKLEFEFHDFKKNILTKDLLKKWKSHHGEWPINPRGRTFKQLKDEYENANDAQKIKLILSNTSLVKRPILEKEGKVLLLGYDIDFYDKL